MISKHNFLNDSDKLFILIMKCRMKMKDEVCLWRRHVLVFTFESYFMIICQQEQEETNEYRLFAAFFKSCLKGYSNEQAIVKLIIMSCLKCYDDEWWRVSLYVLNLKKTVMCWSLQTLSIRYTYIYQAKPKTYRMWFSLGSRHPPYSCLKGIPSFVIYLATL